MYEFEPDNLSLTAAKDAGAQSFFYVQTSLLYTNEQRQRLLRIHNYCVKTSRDAGEIYGALDYQAVVAAIVRKKLPSFVSQVPLIDIQLEAISDFKKLFKGLASQTSADFQGATLPFLALAFLGLLKSTVFQAHYINNCGLSSQEQQRGLGHEPAGRAQQGAAGDDLQEPEPEPVRPERAGLSPPVRRAGELRLSAAAASDAGGSVRRAPVSAGRRLRAVPVHSGVG